MKLRRILLILGLLALLSAASSGYMYHLAIIEAEYKKTEFQAVSYTEIIYNIINSFLSDKLKTVKALSGLPELKQVLAKPNTISLDSTNLILDNFRDSLIDSLIEDCVVYVMDREGKTISSSNRESPESFVGKNYSFRPYFQQALNGSPSVYMALGVTSKKRGVYYSSPVYDQDQITPIGVVAIKFSIETIEEKIIHSASYKEGMITLITDPHGIIFISNRKELLFMRLWNVPDKKNIDIETSQQFGQEIFKWAESTPKGKDRVIDKSGNEYLLYQNKTEFLPGWTIFHFYDLKIVSKIISAPPIRTIEHATVILCVLIGFTVLSLYFMAKSDIEGRMKAENSLMKSEEKFRLMFDQVQMGLALIEIKTQRFVQINEKYCNIIGYTKKELDKISLMEIIHPDDRQLKLTHLKKLIEGEIQKFSIEKRFVRKDGSIVWVNFTVSLLHDTYGKASHYIAVIKDITRRKQTDEALLNSVSLLDATLEATVDGILVVDNEGSVSTFNKKFIELWHLPDSILEPKNDKQIIAFVMEQLDNPEKFFEEINEIYTQLELEIYDELRFKDGRVFERVSKPQKIKNSVVGRVWSFRDMTQRYRNEADLRKLSSAIEQSPVTVVITNKEGVIEYVNPTFSRVTGYSYKEAIGQNPRILQSGRHSPDFYKTLWKTILAGNVWTGEIINKRKNDEIFWERVAIAPLLSDSGTITAFVAVKEDISEQKQAEKDLKENYEILERFKKAAVERELKMIDLKKKVNELLNLSGQKEEYKIVR